MSINIKFKADKTKFKKSIRSLKTTLKTGIMKGMSEAGKTVSENIHNRFTSAYPNISDNAAKGVINNLRPSKPVFNGNNIIMGIGNIHDLDRATEVMAKSTGKTYNLWRLLELGWGMKGGFRSDLYDIYPIYPTSAQGQQYYKHYGGTRRKGVHMSNPNRKVKPALVFYYNGKLTFAARVQHPGAEGKYFFLSITRDWYTEDRAVFIATINRIILDKLKEINYKGRSNA